MRSSKWREDTELVRRMRAAGVPLELEEEKSAVTPPAIGLSIERNAEGIAEAIGESTTGYILDVCIVPNVRWPIEIASATLQLPWDDRHFQWIRDPQESSAQDGMYWLPGTSLYYPRDQVINHLIGCGHALQQGRSLSGILLGQGQAMPKTVLHGNLIPAFVHIFDQFGREYSAGIPLRADRLSIRPRRKSTRGPLFSHPEAKVK